MQDQLLSNLTLIREKRISKSIPLHSSSKLQLVSAQGMCCHPSSATSAKLMIHLSRLLRSCHHQTSLRANQVNSTLYPDMAGVIKRLDNNFTAAVL